MWICRWTGSSDRPLWSPTEPRRGTEKHMAGPGGVFIRFHRDFQPWRWTWNIIMEVWKIIFLSKWACSSSRRFCLRLCWGRGFWGNWMDSIFRFTQKLKQHLQKKGTGLFTKLEVAGFVLFWVCEISVPFIFLENFHQILLRRCWNLRNCSMEFSGSLNKW